MQVVMMENIQEMENVSTLNRKKTEYIGFPALMDVVVQHLVRLVALHPSERAHLLRAQLAGMELGSH